MEKALFLGLKLPRENAIWVQISLKVLLVRKIQCFQMVTSPSGLLSTERMGFGVRVTIVFEAPKLLPIP